MNFVELAGWITLGLVLLSQVCQGISSNRRHRAQLKIAEGLVAQQEQVTECIRLLDTGMQNLQADLCEHAKITLRMADEVKVLGEEVIKVQDLVTKNSPGA